MIPDYQTLMRPVLEASKDGEVRISDVVHLLAEQFQLTDKEREELLPSGKQPIFTNRVHWAKTYLAKAGLVNVTRRGYFIINKRGTDVLNDPNVEINNQYLKQFDEFKAFLGQAQDTKGNAAKKLQPTESIATPDEVLRAAYKGINAALSTDLLDRVRVVSPIFLEQRMVALLIAMGYGGSSEDAGRALGKTGDNGIDGVIDQDLLGVDQIYIQAKRYAANNTVGAGNIRDFFGALNLKKAQKGIFITTSSFSPSAIQTAKDLGSRIVLIDGIQLTKLMFRYNIGCRNEEILYLRKIDEEFFD